MNDAKTVHAKANVSQNRVAILTKFLSDDFFRYSPMPMQIWKRVDDDFVYIKSNEAMTRLDDGKASRLIGKPLSYIYPQFPAIHDALDQALGARGLSRLDAWYTLKATGKRKYIKALYFYLEPDLVGVVLLDATEEKLRERSGGQAQRLESDLNSRLATLRQKIVSLEHSEHLLEENLARFEDLTANLPFGLFRVSFSELGSCTFDYISVRARRLLGIDRDDTSSPTLAPFYENLSTHDRIAFKRTLHKALEARRSMTWEGEAIVQGSVRFLRIEMRPEDKANAIYNGTVFDLTEERHEEESRKALIEAIDAIARAIETYQGKLAHESSSCEAGARTSLSRREAQVADLLLQGLRNREIAKRLSITESTVKKHVTSILQKFDVTNRAEFISMNKRERR